MSTVSSKTNFRVNREVKIKSGKFYGDLVPQVLFVQTMIPLKRILNKIHCQHLRKEIWPRKIC
ncbi:hypothetical protein L345_12154, partial [Ophiophagus hannah]